MNQEDQREYEERMGSPEMEYLQYQIENPEMFDQKIPLRKDQKN